MASGDPTGARPRSFFAADRIPQTHQSSLARRFAFAPRALELVSGERSSLFRTQCVCLEIRSMLVYSWLSNCVAFLSFALCLRIWAFVVLFCEGGVLRNCGIFLSLVVISLCVCVLIGSVVIWRVWTWWRCVFGNVRESFVIYECR